MENNLIENEEQKKENVNNIEDFNIFNEIKDNSIAQKELLDEKTKNEKNIYDYLLFYWNIIKIFDYILFFIIVFWLAYIFIQKSDSYAEKSYLNLICPILVWWEINTYISWNACSSITALNDEYTNKLTNLKQKNFSDIWKILPDLYSLTYKDSKEKEFLLNKSKDRLKVLNVIEEFENLKMNYWNWDSKKVVCKSMAIDENKVVKFDCEAYSTEWDEIPGYSSEINEKYYWKSIAVALSFLDYLKNNSSKFTLINQQKEFSQDMTNTNYYFYKTKFKIELKYKWDDIIL